MLSCRSRPSSSTRPYYCACCCGLDHDEPCAAGPRWAARCRVLSRARISFDTRAPCVLASHSPIAPRQRRAIMNRAHANAVERLAAEIADAAGAPVELERPSDAAHGDYATNVALRLAGARKRAPRELAEELAEAAVGSELVERAEVAGPGFVNLWVGRRWYADALGELLAAGRDYGSGSA